MKKKFTKEERKLIKEICQEIIDTLLKRWSVSK